MRQFILSIALTLSLVVADCPPGYTLGPAGDRCFKVFETPATYFAAEHTCSKDGAHLASIRSGYENTFLGNLIPDGFDFDHWIGLTTLIFGWEWSWLDDSAVLYANWANLQPNATNQCTILSGSTLKWMTNPCGTKLPFICNLVPGTASCN